MSLTHKTNHNKCSILIVDEHPITRYGLRELFRKNPLFEVRGDTVPGPHLVKTVSELEPDLAIFGVSLQGFNLFPFIKKVGEINPQIAIMVFSFYEDNLYAERALKAGARGYLLKKEPVEKIFSGIQSVLNGEIYVSEEIVKKMLRKMVKPGNGDGWLLDKLSDRELQIFELIGLGGTTRTIAKALLLSIKTVETHFAHIKEKLGLNNSTELIQAATKWQTLLS